MGNNLRISSPCIWVRSNLTIGDNVNVGGIVLSWITMLMRLIIKHVVGK